MICKITPMEHCRYCHGTGTVTEWHDYGSTRAAEYLTCDCVSEQLPEEFDDRADEVEIVRTPVLSVRPGREYEPEDNL
jgi:hypothetical protein